MLGCKQVMPHRFMVPQKLLDLMVEEEVTISAGVPTIWQGIRSILEENPDKYDMSKFSRLTCGGSAPPVSMMRWYWETHGIEMVQGWGMTTARTAAGECYREAQAQHGSFWLR